MKVGTGVRAIRRPSIRLVAVTLAVAMSAIVASAALLRAQEALPGIETPAGPLFIYGRLHGAQQRMDEIMSTSAAATTIPLWSYTTTASRDSNSYSGQMVGRSPDFNGHRATTVRTFLIPVKFTFPNADVYDPSINDGCTPGGTTVLGLNSGSPIFKNATSAYTMNGVNVGTTQYIDAFERANFWSKVSGTPYHTTLSSTPIVTAVQNVSVPLGDAEESLNTGCRKFGGIELSWWDPSLIGGVGLGEAGTLLANVAASNGVGPTDLSIFIFNSVILSVSASPVASGYHNAFFTGGGSGPVQTYAVTDFDTSGLLVSPDIETLSHEVGEWMDDPLGTNPTPNWGHVGQVTGCQNNLEVGDPLSGTGFPGVTLGGFTYHPQELAFFSWFYGAPSIGAGGKYSDNGTFTGDAGAICF
jgi:hypothetical protein